MGFFKSKEQKRLERDMEIKRAISKVKRQITELEKSEQEWLAKAKRAKQINSPEQLEFMRKSLKATAFQRRMLERQLLTIEAAKQMKDQAESHMIFAQTMGTVSESIADIYNATDLEKTQINFQQAMQRAESMSQRMDLFLDMSKDTLFTAESSMGEELVSDDEIDEMIGLAPSARKARTRDELDREIAEELGELDEEEKAEVERRG
ncbi:MAG: hypothetical protein KDB07_01885 [Planctomycetes bacterium]|nr:hypothetical protein [Planctomycetota bacterium]